MTLNRLRESGDLVTADFVARQTGPGVPPDRELLIRPFTRGTQFSRIHDEIGKPIRNGAGDCIPKPVEHYKIRVNDADLLPWYRYYDMDRDLIQTIYPVSSWAPVDWDFLSRPSRLASVLSDVPAFAVRHHSLAAFERFETQFPQEISLPNFFWELREIGSLGSLIRDHAGTWMQRLRAAPGDLLNWEFGWKPFASDLIKLGNLTKIIEMRLEALKKTFGKVTRLGYYAKDWYDYPDLYDLVFPTISWQGLQTELRVTKIVSEFRVGALHYHAIPYLNSVIGRLRAFYGALGLGNPLKVFWEAIPYSFVVDWFLDVGSALSTLDAWSNDRTVPWEIYNVNWSMKTRLTFDLQQVNHPASQPFWFKANIGSVDVEYYRRMPGYPEINWLTANLSLSPRQATLAAALLLG